MKIFEMPVVAELGTVFCYDQTTIQPDVFRNRKNTQKEVLCLIILFVFRNVWLVYFIIILFLLKKPSKCD